MLRKAPVRLVPVALALAVLFPACTNDGGDSPLTPSPLGRLTIEEIASSASSDAAAGLLRPTEAPSPSGGPRATVTGNQTIVNGGTLTVTVTADAPFTTIYMFVGGRTLGLISEAPGGVEGHYEINLGAAASSATVLLTFPQEIPLESFDLQFAVANAAGAVGPYAGLSTSVTSVGTGDVQVTLSWDADSDVDLHVVAPGGEEIYYGNRESASGGQLDLDSNAACEIDGVRNENITWPVGRAPQGTYTVRVDYWDSCGVAQTNFTVRVNNGGTVQLFTGT
ncbi:MAG TPA: hypothetical protein VD833_20950, partial [Vicinamibacterales bacterium]|nr:hypothetical protein [Vicinamibacterales bacterium]